MGKLRTVDSEGKTSCCNAFTEYDQDAYLLDDELIEYCKACYKEVVPSCEPVVVTLPSTER